jgi:hypothetical protein
MSQQYREQRCELSRQANQEEQGHTREALLFNVGKVSIATMHTSYSGVCKSELKVYVVVDRYVQAEILTIKQYFCVFHLTAIMC